MTKQEVIDYITLKLATPITLAQNVIDSFLKLLDFSSQSAVDDVIPDWTALITFQTDGSAGGKYCLHADDNGKKRIFETKIDDNLNNPPPTDPAVTENASWVEISQSAGSGISEWAAGVYGSGLVIVFHNHSVDGRGLYQLVDAARPYASADIEAEILAGDWELIFKEYVDAQVSSIDSSVDTYTRIFEDFDLGPLGYFSNTSFNNGGGVGGTFAPSSFGQDSTEKAIGVLEYPTGASTAGGCALVNTVYRHPLGFGAIHRLKFRAALSALSDGVNAYNVRMGYMNGYATSIAATSGAFFRYTHASNGGRWEAVCISGAATQVDTGIAATASGVFSTFEIVINSDATSVEFYIDDVLVATIATNIPNTSGMTVGQAAVIEKVAGGASRSLYLDYVEKTVQRTTAR